MRDFVRTTWLPTALFAAATIPLLLSNMRCGAEEAFGPALTALVVVPVVWHWYVVGSDQPRLGRAALAGASAAYLIVTLSHVVVGVRFSLTHSWSQLGLGAIEDGLADILVIVGGLLVGAPIGALLGMLLARVQRTHSSNPPRPVEGTVTKLRSALTAIMIAILLSPVLAYLALASRQELLVPLAGKYSIGYSFALAATWMVALPVAAVLGARRAVATLVTRRSWTPAMVLLAPSIVVGSMHGGHWAVCSGLSCAVLVPLVWSQGEVRDSHVTIIRRGAAAGAAIAFLAQAIPAVVAVLWLIFLRKAAPDGGGGPGGHSNPAASLSLLTPLLAALVGAALGGVLARNLARVDATPIATQRLR